MQNRSSLFSCLAVRGLAGNAHSLMRKQLLHALGALTILLLPSCVVYMPMQCAAPQITAKNQSEVTVSSYLNGRFDIAGTYSPVQHLLVRAAYSGLSADTVRNNEYYCGQQYDLGLGTYWRMGDKGLVGALGGFGKAQTQTAYSSSGFLSRVTQSRYDLRYNKLFGEIYGTFQANNFFSTGGACRVTQLNFSTLTYDNKPMELKAMTRIEPMGFVRLRVGKGSFEDRAVQFQVAIGASSTAGYNENDRNVILPDGVYNLKQSRYYTTVGVTLFPHCLFRKPQPTSVGH